MNFSGHVFEIEFPTASGHTGKVVMDGQELRGVTAVQITGAVDEIVSVALTFLPEKVLVRCEDAKVVATVQKLLAETTDMGAANRKYVIAEPERDTA